MASVNVIEIKDPAGLFTPACTVNPISLLPSSLNVFTRGLLVRNVLEYVPEGILYPVLVVYSPSANLACELLIPITFINVWILDMSS